MSFTRDIPSLSTLCLRSIGDPSASTSHTFESAESESCKGSFEPRTPASKLLRRLYSCNTVSKKHNYLEKVRKNANDVDMNAPFIAVKDASAEDLIIENSNLAIDYLQSIIDSLVDLGRMDDSRLNVEFFREWVAAVKDSIDSANNATANNSNKRKRSEEDASIPAQLNQTTLGSLSLNNCASLSSLTFGALKEADVGSCLGVLDLTGVHGLTDKYLEEIVSYSPHIRRLSIKNCRKLTNRGLQFLTKLKKLQAIDVGGSFNLTTSDFNELILKHPGTKVGTLNELGASGLGWTDESLETLISLTKDHLVGLSIGFSPKLNDISAALSQVGNTLTRLAIHFCNCVDIALLIEIGKILPKLQVLDIRGANSITTLTSFFDARATVTSTGYNNNSQEADEPVLFILARYSGITSDSIVETRSLHNLQFECILDGGGIGGGIRRKQ